jgi:hypothetical protein
MENLTKLGATLQEEHARLSDDLKAVTKVRLPGSCSFPSLGFFFSFFLPLILFFALLC